MNYRRALRIFRALCLTMRICLRSLWLPYFFPVNVLAAVMLTPGNGVLPLRTEPVISYVGAAAGAAVCSVTVGEGGAGSWAPALAAQRIATK